MQFEKGKLFAWGDSVLIANGPVEVERACVDGETSQILDFDFDCGFEVRKHVCHAIMADITFLREGPDWDGDWGDDEYLDDDGDEDLD